MVMGRGAEAGFWARTTGASPRTERKIARRDTSLIRKDPSDQFMNVRSKRRSLSQPLRIDAAEEETGTARSLGAKKEEGSAEEPPAAAKKNPFECIFLLHAGASLVFFGCELASPLHRERGSFRRTRIKIEFSIPSGPAARQFHLYN